jgi:hypothetical protein
MIIKSNSKMAARYCRVLGMTEPVVDDSIVDGVYVGKTKLYGMPFFLEPDKLVNPHISILGMTGSGKTYLVKSLVARLCLTKMHGILIIDWSSEYTDVVEFLCGKVKRVAAAGDLDEMRDLTSGINSIDLSAIESEAGKRAVAGEVLNRLHSFMLSLTPGTETCRVLVVDEAWKLLNFEQSLGRLFREGRKFGFMIIAATQLVKDVNNEVLANAASSFVFRLQGTENLDSLITSGLIDQGYANMVGDLGRGSCVVSLVHRNEDSPRRFLIDKVYGFSFKGYFIKCGSMAIRITSGKLATLIDSVHLDNSAKARITKFFDDNQKGADLARLVGLLFDVGLERQDVVTFSRSLGIKDKSTALAIESLKGVEFVK